MMYICLIDCDNFYASCEKLFCPKFRNKPLVVVSGKNGIVIARSKEAKALNIPMGAASFEYKSLFLKENVIVRGTNFPLYKDISNRIRETVATFNFSTYLYSIDEMFLQIPVETFSLDLIEKIQKKIKRWVGIDVSIGVSKTKTLAKLTTKLAKTLPSHRKALICAKEINTTLETFPVKDIWGIGRASFKKLQLLQIKNTKDLISLNSQFIKKTLGIHGARIVSELQGINAHSFIQKDVDKSMQITKTFQTEIVSIKTINAIISTFIAEGCAKLRKQQRQCPYFLIFLESSRYKKNKETFVKTFSLDEPSNYTPDFLHLKELALKTLSDGDILIKRAGVCFYNLLSTEATQKNLFSLDKSKNINLMPHIDKINAKYGKKTLRFASQSYTFTKNKPSSPRYTTAWTDLLIVTI